MTEHHLNVMLTEQLVEVQRLHVVLTEAVQLLLGQTTVVGLCRTLEGVLIVCIDSLIDVDIVR